MFFPRLLSRLVKVKLFTFSFTLQLHAKTSTAFSERKVDLNNMYILQIREWIIVFVLGITIQTYVDTLKKEKKISNRKKKHYVT